MASKTTIKPRPIYKISFINEGKVFEIYASSVSQGELWGFVTIEGLLFGEKGNVVIDPAEESLNREFAGVQRTYIPMHSIVRIDEVEKQGTSKVLPLSSSNEKVTRLPVYTPPQGPPREK